MKFLILMEQSEPKKHQLWIRLELKLILIKLFNAFFSQCFT